MEIYVGYSQDIIKRIIDYHCSGNVDNSILRKHVASRITGGNVLRNNRRLENRVSNYIRSGKWKYVICKSPGEARDFKKYVICQYNPPLNVHRGAWNARNNTRYRGMLRRLEHSAWFTCGSIRNKQTDAAGVCVFYHEREPSRSVRS